MPETQHSDADASSGSVRVHAYLPGSERRSRTALVVSFALHALIIYLAVRLTAVVALPKNSPIGDAIRMVLSGGGGGGGQSGAAFDRSHPQPPPPVVPPPPSPVVPPPPAPPLVTPQTIPPPPPAAPAPVAASEPAGVASSGTGRGSGGGSGTGNGPGTGSGQGPGSGSGTGGGNGGGNGGFPPVNKQMILPPPDCPKELRGQSINVSFTVNAEGVVTDLSVDPPIKNRSFAKKFDEIMRGYRFTPARSPDGKNIAGVTVIAVTFGGT